MLAVHPADQRAKSTVMPRANRYFLPGHVWHLTHRCHDQSFLMGLACDRRRWVVWLFEARKRYGLTVLNYAVTRNHVHLLVHADGDRLVIPRAMQLLAGRTAQAFNHRKGRSGAFWEDRYHATAVETGRHLRRCMTYIDLNMVRAGVVRHPAEWECCGYREIQNPPRRYRRIDRDALVRLLDLGTFDDVRAWQRESVRQCLERGDLQRRSEWTESIAVGDEAYAARVQADLGFAAYHRAVHRLGDGPHVLREAATAYDHGIELPEPVVSIENRLLWRLAD